MVEVFGPSFECTLPEDGTPAPFTADGTSSAGMTGTLAVACWDLAAGAGGAATAPAGVTGSVRLQAPSLGLDVVGVAGDRPAEIAQTVSRCR